MDGKSNTTPTSSTDEVNATTTANVTGAATTTTTTTTIQPSSTSSGNDGVSNSQGGQQNGDDVRKCCELLNACKTDNDCMMAFALLPEMLKSRALNETESNDIIRALPINLLQRMLINQDSDESARYRQVAIDILSVLLANCCVEKSFQFEPLIQPILAWIVSQRDWEMSKLETMCKILHVISNGMLIDMDDIIELIDIIATTLYDHSKKELPSLQLLGIVSDLLKRLLDEPDILEEYEFSKRVAPSHLRSTIARLLQTQHLPENYRSQCFMLSTLLVCVLGYRWFEGDNQFLILLATLTHVQFRMILDDPKLIRIEDLIECTTLGESFIQCVEQGDFLDDEQATTLSRCCHDCVAYVCEYLYECRRRKDECDDVELETTNVEVVLYRFICSFMAVGGYRAIAAGLVHKILPILIDIAYKSCERGDVSLVAMLLPSLPNFEHLPNSCLRLIAKCLQKHSKLHTDDDGDGDGDGDGQLLSEISFVIDELSKRNDWYTKEDIVAIKEIAKKFDGDDGASLAKALDKLSS